MDSDSCCPSVNKELNIKFYKTKILMSNLSELLLKSYSKSSGSIFSIIAYFKIILNQVSDKNVKYNNI